MTKKQRMRMAKYWAGKDDGFLLLLSLLFGQSLFLVFGGMILHRHVSFVII
jgi:hypothetical protein